ncbi:Hypothetical predicted protein [Pelobates cultripes]|uniref:Uncharacterized protein n=1 Tax=Pelobates cultripes TaxID=61616 RepID=A0AAD1VUF2_PELCU|nr:Hypothetical predicted protein [Pelobates cultripes]
MVILPKIQYLFRTLPNKLPKQYLLELQNILNNYVWDYKKTRVAKTTLYRPPAQGGLGLPDVTGYYRAAHITPLVAISHRQDLTSWAEIEKNHARGLSIPLLAWLPKTHRPKISELLSTTALTLSIWDTYRKKMVATATLSPELQLDTLQLLIPDFNYKLWYRHSTATFSYRQMRSWVLAQPTPQQTKPSNTHWTIIKICTKTKPATKLISTTYASEHMQTQTKPPSFKTAWEQDMGHQLTEEQWQNIYYVHK